MFRWLATTVISLVIVCALMAAGAYGWFTYDDSRIEADYYFQLAKQRDDANPEGSVEALRYYQRAGDVYDNIGAVDQAVKVYIHQGWLHMKFGNVLQVERLMLKAIELGGDRIPERLKLTAYLLLASTSEPDKSIDYAHKVLNYASSDPMVAQHIRAYFLIGQAYETKALFEKAERYYIKAERLVARLPEDLSFVDVILLYERLGEIYTQSGKKKRAISYYNKAVGASDAHREYVLSINYMRIIGDLYEESKNHTKACEYWRRSSDTAKDRAEGHMADLTIVSKLESCYQAL